jgi:hypothetical protein
MEQKGETPAVGAVRGSEMHIAAASGDASKDALAHDDRQGLAGDPLRILRLHWGLCSLDLGRRDVGHER